MDTTNNTSVTIVTNPTNYCYSNILRFVGMLTGTVDKDRNSEVIFAQLELNLGRYVKLKQREDGKELWQQLEKCIVGADDYSEFIHALNRENCA